MAVETKNALCRFCHALCPVKLTLDDGRITSIIGDKDNPAYHGYSCIKGRKFHEFQYAPDRIRQPLKRSSDGSFAPVSLHQSLDEIAGKLGSIIDQHGQQSVAMYAGTFSHFCPAGVMTRHAFMDAIESPMRFSNATIDQPGKPIAMAKESDWPYRLELAQADMLAELSRIDRQLGSKSVLAESASAIDGLSLLLVSRRLHAVYNSVGHRLPELSKKVPYNPVFLNPADASILGIKSGDRIRLATARASVIGIVELDEDILQGVVAVSHGFANSRSGNDVIEESGTSVSALLDDEVDFDPISGLPVMSAVPVSVSVPAISASGH